MRKKILLVDDSRLIVKIAAAYLSRGYEVVTASSGPEALAMAMSEHPDLILMDLNLPGMDGYKVASVLGGNPGTGDVPVVMMTTENEIPKLGGMDYLLKPFDPTSLLEKVGAYLH